ncbi:hypothetical protein ARSEF4850_010013 [Beauveria asiatica]
MRFLTQIRHDADHVAYEGRRSHADVLPEKYTMSIFFSDYEMQVCKGSSLYALTTQLRGRIGDDYKKLLTRVLMRHRNLFPLSSFGIEDYKWALCTVWSRGMDLTVSEGNSLRLLAPFADMLNHSSEVKQCHAYDPTTGDLSILASKDYNAGDQVFIYYGPVPNNRLLRLYGFVLPENPHDSYDLVLQTSPMAPLYEQKERLWKLAGLDTTCTVPLTANDPLPRSVFRYLRIQRLDESLLGAMTMQIATGTDEKMSDDSEMQILQFLIDSISAILESFSIPLDVLTAQLSAGDVYPVGGNAWAAAQVSASEQRILRLARDKAERLLSAVGGDHGDAQRQRRDRCARCGKAGEEAAAATATRLMACGRCKAVRYCGRECQVGHFKEHKALCRSLAGKKVK